MKAIIYTADKLSLDVVQRALDEESFTSIETLASPTMPATTGDECIYIIDCDMFAPPEFWQSMSEKKSMVLFGSHEGRSRLPQSLSNSATNRFLYKPFSRDQILQILEPAVLEDLGMSLDANLSGRRSVRGKESLTKQWRLILETLEKERADRQKVMEMSPDALRQYLQKSAVPDATGFPRVPKEIFPISSALIIESDETIAASLARYLANKCVMQSDIVSNGHEAFGKIEDNRYDLLILRWEIKDPTGLALYNRLRSQETTRFIPTLVATSHVKASDFRLLDEDFNVGVIEIPLTEKPFSSEMGKVVTSSVISRMHADDLIDLVRESITFQTFIDDPKSLAADPKDENFLCVLRLAGERFLAEAKYSLAETVFAMAWASGDQRLSLLTGYAKACHLTGRHDLAKKILSRAQVLGPKNVERLCLLGEVDLCLHQPEEARRRFEQALLMDQDNVKAQSGVNVAITMQRYPGPPVAKFASYLNLIGIDLSHKGQKEDAIHYYKSAMAFVYNKNDIAKLWFNVGICLARNQGLTSNSEEMKAAFKNAFDLSGGALKKAEKYFRSTTEDSTAIADAENEFERM